MTQYSGVLAAAGAYILWGILPIYWKLLGEVPAYEILCHRMSWSLLVTFGLLAIAGRLRQFFIAVSDWRQVLFFLAAALLLSVNWLLYIWAVNAGFILEASLGYFINPLVNVLFGMIFFQERMRPLQWLALVFALLGVVYLTIFYGRFPWIALTLAITFGTYGLLHKKSKLAALDALCLETGVLFLPAVLLLIGTELHSGGAFGHIGLSGSLLLVGTGVATTVPLLLFGYAAGRIKMSTLGLLQYMAPTINLLLGTLIYHEDFPLSRMVGFCLIWSGLAVYMGEGMLHRLANRRRALKEKVA